MRSNSPSDGACDVTGAAARKCGGDMRWRHAVAARESGMPSARAARNSRSHRDHRAKPAAPDNPQPDEHRRSKRAELRRAALEDHEFPTPGKVAIAPTKPLANQRDLALAYSPGVAAACEEIVADPAQAPTATPRAATWWRWSPTAPPCWAWATSARSPASR
jgi:hypothetical protein